MQLASSLWMLAAVMAAAADDVKPRVVARPVEEGGVTKVYLAPRYATAIRMPEPVSSLVVGDPGAFSAEHSEKEPNLVLVKPVILEAAQTNLLISTVSGNQVSLLLVSRGEGKPEAEPSVDFLMRYKPAARFRVDRSSAPKAVVPQTAALDEAGGPPRPEPKQGTKERSVLDELLSRQRRAPMPRLYGTKPGTGGARREPVKAGVSEVFDEGQQVVVLFSAVNLQPHAVELMPPQVQLGGKRRMGLLRREQWVVAEQLHVAEFRWSRRRIGPGERADGVMVFARPSYKQSTESVFLQVAESGSVDRPALAPIAFGSVGSRNDAMRNGGME